MNIHFSSFYLLYIHNVVKILPKKIPCNILRFFCWIRSLKGIHGGKFFMLPLIYSTPIFGTILHHSHVFIFPCFHNKVMFRLTFCTLHVLILGIRVPWFGFKSKQVFVMVGSCPFGIYLFWLFHGHGNLHKCWNWERNIVLFIHFCIRKTCVTCVWLMIHVNAF